MARYGGLISDFWGVSGGTLGGGFEPPAMKGAEAKGDLQGHGMGLCLVGFAGSWWLLITLAKGGSVPSIEKRLLSATPAAEGTIEKGNG